MPGSQLLKLHHCHTLGENDFSANNIGSTMVTLFMTELCLHATNSKVVDARFWTQEVSSDDFLGANDLVRYIEWCMHRWYLVAEALSFLLLQSGVKKQYNLKTKCVPIPLWSC